MNKNVLRKIGVIGRGTYYATIKTQGWKDKSKYTGGFMLPELKYDEKGLIPAIIQDVDSGDV
ncbi:MAG: hypothetical protein C0408_11605, partial [Odoribacter sp.]|nr:hypothetical protein [Odoribacter sp.]